MNLSLLLDYTDWERSKWRSWFRKHGADPLKISIGPHGDGRFTTVGDLVRHIFSAEKRYVERLSGRPLTDTATLPAGDPDALFEFGRQSRRDLKAFIDTFPAGEWDTTQELKLGTTVVQASPRKIIIHVVTHEIRHWAQVATLLRLNGLTDDFHDFLFSPVLSPDADPSP